MQSYGAVIDRDARLLDDIPKGGVEQRWCVVVGSENDGIGPGVREVCRDTLVRIWCVMSCMLSTAGCSRALRAVIASAAGHSMLRDCIRANDTLERLKMA